MRRTTTLPPRCLLPRACWRALALFADALRTALCARWLAAAALALCRARARPAAGARGSPSTFCSWTTSLAFPRYFLQLAAAPPLAVGLPARQGAGLGGRVTLRTALRRARRRRARPGPPQATFSGAPPRCLLPRARWRALALRADALCAALCAR